MSNEQRQEVMYQIRAAMAQCVQGLDNMKPSDRDAADELVCALREILKSAEALSR